MVGLLSIIFLETFGIHAEILKNCNKISNQSLNILQVYGGRKTKWNDFGRNSKTNKIANYDKIQGHISN